MGYTTEFTGRIAVEPPLNPQEIAYLRKFAGTRRMDRANGPYFVDGSGYAGQGRDADIREHNKPPAGQPGLWCKWEPTADGTAIEWNGHEKFYAAAEWMAYLVEHFLKPGARTQGHPGFEGFGFDHLLDGVIDAQGEEPWDTWQLVVRANDVSTIGPEEPDTVLLCGGCHTVLPDEDSACCPGAEVHSAYAG
ncbi:hypothetical protein CFP65_5853 [Kitasatospora sp. MMS16-BH015]|uniref:hypothetical protein n=1 Tax=Kitasatospora sp. MMS16-BH015 TaxID=2018025 RepID=UPI000CA097A3|nr:hypothetical protein [Kitasatospora sp. MMS16-BH015]AUG80534.1 hypothetical protein CFP65_5853 [Kitasatospora sp. MMS16-BH015]